MIVSHPFQSDNVLGYRIVDRIGAGGYGEVFKVEAPGGILKALKVLSGFGNEKKAQNELAALDAIKKLRHPFLLSLERIEVVDERLVVITELADKSLADLFNEYASQGLTGIPREELLQYISETAEALDYLSLEHQLQHLDVKPENLLLVGNHIKLADFGLVKHIQDDHITVMTGLTPAYAAPELYDGRPSSSSDQYSLALMFYEMLTGERCFDGKSQAQLTAQHLNAKPNLSLLPKIDHPAMLRALAKKPELRFHSCREFVDAIKNQKTLHRDKKRLLRSERIPTDEDTKSTVVKPVLHHRQAERTMILSQNALREERRNAVLTDYPEIAESSSDLIPSLIIGVGRLGTEVCRRVKRRMKNSLSHPDVPAIQILCLDSERRTLDQPLGQDSINCLEHSDILQLPLRKPEEYRSRARVHCEWLNRRWIYSVPKSLQTEGIRPLGRLALIDNFDSFWKRLEEKSERLIALDSLALSAERMGREFKRGKARVFIVSSISGGIGSGLTLDLAYAVKTMFSQLGLPTDSIHGLLLHGLNQHEKDSQLCTANTIAFLSELAHISQYGYQGEKSAMLPEIHDELPFDYPYFLDLGENLNSSALAEKVDQIADYVFYNSCSDVGSALHSCRELDCEMNSFSLRSFGLADTGLSPENSATLIQAIAKSIVGDWLSSSAPADYDAPKFFHDELQLSELQTAIRTLLQAHIGNSIGRQFNEVKSKSQLTVAEISEFFRLIRNSFLPKDASKPSDFADEQTHWLEGHFPGSLVDLASSNIEKFRSNLIGILDAVFSGKQFSYGTYFYLSKTAIDHLSTEREKARQTAKHLRENIIEYTKNLTAIFDEPRKKVYLTSALLPHITDYISLIEEYFLSEAISLACNGIARHLSQHAEIIQRSRINLENNAHQLLDETALTSLERRVFGWDRQVFQMFTEKIPELVQATELRFYTNAVQPLGSYRELLVTEPVNYDSLLHELSLYAQSEVVSFAKSLDIDVLANVSSNRNSLELSDQIGLLLESANPMLDQCGGTSRLVVAIPERSPGDTIAGAIEDFSMVKIQSVRATSGALVLIQETEDVEIPTITRRLVEKLPDCLEIAKRIRTRSDIEWSPIETIL